MAKNKTEMIGVIFDDTDKQSGPIVDSDNSDFFLQFKKDEDFFSVYENEIEFYKGVEKLVRTDPFYKKYIKYLIEIVGMKTCQVLSNVEIEDKSKVTVEMHHGPMLTLFDVVMIITNWCRTHGIKVTTYSVADMVLEEHRQNHIRVTLLTKSVHQQVTEGTVILNYNQGFGDVNSFLVKYHDGLTKEIVHAMNQYIEWSKENDSFDNDVLQIADKLKMWGNNDLDISSDEEDLY